MLRTITFPQYDFHPYARVEELTPLVFVLGPYTPTTPSPAGAMAVMRYNMTQARECCEMLVAYGVPFVCPNLQNFMMDGLASKESMLRTGQVIMSRCGGIVRLPGWGASEGCKSLMDFVVRTKRDVTVFEWPEGGSDADADRHLAARAIKDWVDATMLNEGGYEVQCSAQPASRQEQPKRDRPHAGGILLQDVPPEPTRG